MHGWRQGSGVVASEHMIPQWLAPLLAAALTQVLMRPALTRYIAWKANPARVQVARRNWRGHYVPDLMIKRCERAFWISLAVTFLLGTYALYLVFNPPFEPIYTPNRPI